MPIPRFRSIHGRSYQRSTHGSSFGQRGFKSGHIPEANSIARPKFEKSCINRENEISGLVILAPLEFLWPNRKQLSSKTLNLYIDNNNVATSPVRSVSGIDFIDDSISCFCGDRGSFLDRPAVGPSKREAKPRRTPHARIYGSLQVPQ